MFDTCSGAGGGSREVSMASCCQALHLGSIQDRRRLIMTALALGETLTLPRDDTRRWPAPLWQHQKGAPADDLVSHWDELYDIDIALYLSPAGALHHSVQLAEMVARRVEDFYDVDGGT
ncbi:hypothetical protein FBULB1_5924 [Fusarium bulbicola]|nr:hypothetical protein FBULB1_5924 [Fusarium bulbicola]